MIDASRTGLVMFGLGRTGQIHATNLVRNPRASLKWIVEIDEDKARKFAAANFTDTQVIPPSEMEKALLDPTVDAAVITTPTALHEETILRCLQAGKAVFCEKPIASAAEAIERCYKEAENRSLPLFCGFNRRFDPTVRSVFDSVQNDGIGQVQVVKITSRDSPMPSPEFLKTSGGYFHDCGLHDVDLICWIMGEAPHTVFCLAHAFHSHIAEMDDVDTVGVIMKFSSGAIGQIDLSRESIYGYDHRIEVFGSGGMLTSDNQNTLSSTHFHSMGSSQPPIKFSFPQRYSEAFDLEMNHFIDVMNNKEVSEVSKQDVLRSSYVIDAIKKSFKTGQPVNL